MLVWLAFLFAQTFFFLSYYGYLSLEDVQGWRGKKPTFIVLIILGSIWGLVAVTGIGVVPDDLYWNVAGVPLLAGQIWLAIGVTLMAWFLYERFVASKGLNRLISFTIFIGIWVVAAVTWIKTPLGPTFNAPGPYLPAREFYPFVDAALFDLGITLWL